MIRISYAAIIFYFLLTMPGCKYLECGQYYDIIRNDDERNFLINWVDKNIFSRELDGVYFRYGELVGPGMHSTTIDFRKMNIEVPNILSEYEIKSVGPNFSHPDVVFIGKHSFQGILITRGDLASSIAGTNVNQGSVIEKNGRMACMCVSKFD